MKTPRQRTNAFTIVEVMTVVTIIGVLSGVAIPMTLRAITRAREKQAEADLEMIANAVKMLANDTGKWPISDQPFCTGRLAWLTVAMSGSMWTMGGMQPVFDLSSPWSGILNGDHFTALGQTWKGPYLEEVPVDPWGHPYVFHAYYRVYLGREVGRSSTDSSYTMHSVGAVVASFGPNGRGVGKVWPADSDDIYLLVGDVSLSPF